MKTATERVSQRTGRTAGLHETTAEWVMLSFPRGYQGLAVDVGASDGVYESNTMILEESRWTVLCIEPNPNFYTELKRRRCFPMWAACDAPERINGAVADFHLHLDDPSCYSALRPTPHPLWKPECGAKWETITVPVKTLDSCLEEAGFGRLDFVSIDTEGTELDVLKGIDLARWKPKLLTVEAWDKDNPIVDYLGGCGYRRTGRALVNDYYERR